MNPSKPSCDDEFFLSASGAESDALYGGVPDDDREALDHLFSAAYEELRSLAAAVRRGHPEATINPTALVNEAWLKLSRSPSVGRASHLHFKRIAARAMRQVLISAARRRHSDKRTATTVELDDYPQPELYSDQRLLALDSALDELAAMNPRHAVVVESRFFGGMEVSEITASLGISEATVLRDWRAARAWLAQRLDTATLSHGL